MMRSWSCSDVSRASRVRPWGMGVLIDVFSSLRRTYWEDCVRETALLGCWLRVDSQDMAEYVERAATGLLYALLLKTLGCSCRWVPSAKAKASIKCIQIVKLVVCGRTGKEAVELPKCCLAVRQCCICLSPRCPRDALSTFGVIVSFRDSMHRSMRFPSPLDDLLHRPGMGRTDPHCRFCPHTVDRAQNHRLQTRPSLWRDPSRGLAA